MCATMGVVESIAATQGGLNSHYDVIFRSGSQKTREKVAHALRVCIYTEVDVMLWNAAYLFIPWSP